MGGGKGFFFFFFFTDPPIHRKSCHQLLRSQIPTPLPIHLHHEGRAQTLVLHSSHSRAWFGFCVEFWNPFSMCRDFFARAHECGSPFLLLLFFFLNIFLILGSKKKKNYTISPTEL